VNAILIFRIQKISILNTLDASTTLARLDERLAIAPEPVRAGWIQRALVYEACASLRLDGSYVSAHDLVLRLNNTLNRPPDQDIGRARDIHAMLSTLIRRNPQHLFKPRRVLALTRLRLQSRVVDHPDLPDWLQNRIHTADEMSEALENAEILSHFALGRDGGKRHGYARRNSVSDALATELRRLHDAGIYTRDLQETNIMVEEHDGALHFYFLDLEDFRRVSTLSPRRRMLNLVHLDRSIGRFLSRAGRLDFLYAYLGGKPAREARRKSVAEFLALRHSVERQHS